MSTSSRKPPAKRAPSKRRYDNRQREHQAGQTRAAILQALAAQLASTNSTEFSVADAAAAAGVTPRTVFRYFPTKEQMLEGVSEWVLGITRQVELPASPEDLAPTVMASYRMFEDNADLMRALLLSDLGRGVRSRLSERRRKAWADAIDPVVRGLPATQARAIKAVINAMATAEAWWQLRDAFGVRGPQSARVVAWAVELMLDALRRGHHPFAANTSADA
jgi:AcrR family transcriptional regulator